VPDATEQDSGGLETALAARKELAFRFWEAAFPDLGLA
jgi:hypothetical protein